MAAQKYSIFFVIFIGSCVNSGALSNVSITNKALGCFTFFNRDVTDGDPVILNLGVNDGDATQDCQCKSALLKYSVSQKIGKDVSKLISGSFTAINKKSVALPLSVQSQLIYQKLPLDVQISCANP